MKDIICRITFLGRDSRKRGLEVIVDMILVDIRSLFDKDTVLTTVLIHFGEIIFQSEFICSQ